MARNFYTPINLNALELQNAAIGNLSATSIANLTGGALVKGRIQFDSTNNVLKFYDGSAWKTVSTGAGSFTLGSTTINLGDTVSTIAGMTSITSTAFVGALTGNASTATKFASATSGTINGTNYDGSSPITITAANPNALTIGTGLTGTSYTGASAVTIALATTGTAGTYTKVTTDAYGRVSSGTTLSSSDIPDISATYLTTSTASSTYLTQSSASSTYAPKANPTFTGTVTVPTPTNGTDAANKAYVDNVAQGVNAHDAVQVATTATLAATYTAGTTGADGGTGVGATITFSSTGSTTLDAGAGGVTLALNDRVLVKNGVTADAGTASKANGIYYVTTAGTTGVATVLTRALDADNSIAGDIMAGDLVYIVGGTTLAGTQWVQTATGTATTPTKGIKIGTDAITFAQFSGASSTTAGAGLVANGNVFDVATASSARIVVNADNIDLATTAVSANSYGSSSLIPSFTVDAYGRLTAASTSAHVDATASVKGIASFSSTYFTVTSGAVSLTSLGSLSTTGNAANVTGTVAIGNGGTGATTAAGARTALGATTKFTGSVSLTANTQATINHALGTQAVLVQMFDSSWNLVDMDVLNFDSNNVKVTASVTATYNYVIIG